MNFEVSLDRLIRGETDATDLAEVPAHSLYHVNLLDVICSKKSREISNKYQRRPKVDLSSD